MEKRPVSKSRKKPKKDNNVLRSFYNPGMDRFPGEVNSGEIITVPDESLTVKQLLINHTKGKPLQGKDHGDGYFDTEIPVHMDIVDRMEYNKKLAEDLKEAEKAHKEAVESERKKKIEEAAEKKIAAEKALKEQKDE